MKAQRLGQGGAEWTSAADKEQFQNYTKYTWVDKYGMQGIYHVRAEDSEKGSMQIYNSTNFTNVRGEKSEGPVQM